MSLDNLLSGLTATYSNGDVTVNPSYDAGILSRAQKSLVELDSADLLTSAGLDSYQTLTGENPADYSMDMLDNRKKNWIAGGQSDISLYVKEHLDSLIDEIDEESQSRLAYSFCPNQDSEDNPNDYNLTRGLVHQNNEILKSIEENPNKYFNESLKNESPLIARYIAMDPETFINISKSDAQRTALLAIRKYGASDFLKVSRDILEGQKNDYASEDKAIQRSINSKLVDKSVELGMVLNGQERADLISSDVESLSALGEKYPGAQQIGQFTGEIFQYALANIEQNLSEGQN